VGVNIVQNFTPDHALAAKGLRLPSGNTSTMDSPYLSVISLVKGFGPVYHNMPTMTPDVNSASEISQRYDVIVHSL
jgi:hypothetical protein